MRMMIVVVAVLALTLTGCVAAAMLDLRESQAAYKACLAAARDSETLAAALRREPPAVLTSLFIAQALARTDCILEQKAFEADVEALRALKPQGGVFVAPIIAPLVR